jgi:hypothetical protein
VGVVAKVRTDLRLRGAFDPHLNGQSPALRRS